MQCTFLKAYSILISLIYICTILNHFTLTLKILPGILSTFFVSQKQAIGQSFIPFPATNIKLIKPRINLGPNWAIFTISLCHFRSHFKIYPCILIFFFFQNFSFVLFWLSQSVSICSARLSREGLSKFTVFTVR